MASLLASVSNISIFSMQVKIETADDVPLNNRNKKYIDK